jgi:DNA-binding CsgD family transcriptional regulator
MKDPIDTLSRDAFTETFKAATSVKLATRQWQVLLMLCDGYTSAEIGDQLGISPRTVDGTRKELHHIAGVDNRVMLVRWAIRNGLVQA